MEQRQHHQEVLTATERAWAARMSALEERLQFAADAKEVHSSNCGCSS